MSYEVLIPTLPFIVGYLATYTLYKFGIIKKILHVNIWNFIIGLAFLIAGGAGFILLILIALGMKTTINHELMYWHVEVGISLALITILHIHTYWKSAKNMFIPVKRRVRS
ncbi:MAG: hypothetical protein ACP5OJ_01940 [Methanothermobacter sp.]